ncbi:MAG: YfhO family protein [Eubacteriales bacterium]|nr:YfhO family protein [Eubacteriales bacterium]
MRSKKDALYSVLAFILPAVILSAVLSVNGIYPFGDKSILIYDLRSQYIDFFASLRGGIQFYSFNRAFGGDFFTLAAYYLLSPFNLIILLPWNNIIGAVTLIYYLKVMTAGLTLSVFLRRTRLFVLDKKFTPLFAVIYTFCGFAVIYAQNLMWLDALWLLPLIALTTEILVSEGRQIPFVIAVAAAMVINFYTGFMLVCFSLVYICFLLLTIEHCAKGRTFLRSFTAIFTGLCLSSAIVFTAYNKLAQTKMTDENLLSAAASNFFEGFSDFFDFVFYVSLAAGTVCLILIAADKGKITEQHISANPGAVIIAAVITAAVFILLCVLNAESLIDALKGHLPFAYNLDVPPLYCSSVCVILAAMLPILCCKNRQIKALQYMTLCLWVSMPLVCPQLDLLLHSGQTPISFPARYSYIVSFVLILTAAYTLSSVKINRIPAAAVFVVSVIILLELSVNAAFAFRYNEDVYYGYYPKKSYDSFISVNNDALKKVGANTRTEKSYYRYLNDSMALNYRGLTHYSSLYRRSFNAVMRRLGYASSEYWLSYFGSTPVLDSLFGIDYILDMTDADYASHLLIKRIGFSYASDFYEKTGSTKLIDVYRNTHALPVAYAVDNRFLSADFSGANPFETQNNLLSAMTGKKETPFIGQTAIKQDAGEKNSVSYKLKASREGTLYMYIHSSANTPCAIYINDIYYANYQTAQAAVAYTVYLGPSKSGEPVEIRLEPISGELNYTSIDFYILTKDYTDIIDRLRTGAAAVSDLRGNKINIKAKEGGLIFCSIPYEEGWRIADGSGELGQANGFLCVKLNDGADYVELVYTPPGFWQGCLLSAVGLILLVGMIIRERGIADIRKNCARRCR